MSDVELVELKTPLRVWATKIEEHNKYFPMDRAWFAQAAQRDVSVMFVEDMVVQYLKGSFCTTFIRGSPGMFKSSAGLFLDELQIFLKNILIERGMQGLSLGLGRDHFDRLGIADYDYRPTFTVKNNLVSRIADFPDLLARNAPLTSNHCDEVLNATGMGSDLLISDVQNLQQSLRLLQMDMTLIGVKAPEWAQFDYLLQPTSTFNHADDWALVEGAKLKLGMKIQTADGQDYFTMGNIFVPGPDDFIRDEYNESEKRGMVNEMHRTGGMGALDKINAVYYKHHPEKKPKKK